MFEPDVIAAPEERKETARPAAAPFRHLAIIGNALPRRCGLATYTSHVAEALAQRYPAMRVDHYAMDDETGIEYPPSIRPIIADDPSAYRDAAAEIEAGGAEALWLQHEFGIFGGVAGSHILELVEATSLPLIVTLHTVLERPSEEQEVVLRRLTARAERTIVMAEKGAEILERHYGMPRSRVSVVPHGAPDRAPRNPDELKPHFGWQGRKVLMTFGLLAPDKGIRHMIEAMPAIVRAHPDALYEIVGATHPNVARRQGEEHRQSLIDLARELGVEKHVSFVDRFVEQEELLDMLQATDIYVTPYLNMGQVTSGTLSYAVAVGKPVIATPYIHAQEILDEAHGVIVPPADAVALAAAAIDLLSNDARRASLGRAAWEKGREMIWPRVVEQSLQPLVSARHSTGPAPILHPAPLPLTAVRRMSDGVGMLQHAIHKVPDRNHGYCIDDNARALMTMVRRRDAEAMALAPIYAAFVQHGWNPDAGRFRNFMAYDRQWLEAIGSEDSNGRTLWALGLVAAGSSELRNWAVKLFDEAAPHLLGLEHPRAKAFAALGALALLQSRPDHVVAHELVATSGDQLMRLYATHKRDGWDWFEPWLAYDNARLPETLIRAGMALGEQEMIETGLSTLSWLVDHQSGPRGQFRPVGCKGFGRAYAPPLAFDQQPLEATATVDAAAAAYQASNQLRWRQVARDAFAWFFGGNDARSPLADAGLGSCCDGLMATGVNRNEGAESILSLHLAALTMQEAFGDRNRTGQERGIAAEARILAAS